MTKPNFRIVENSQPHYLENYERFIELYNDSDLTIKQIEKELGWNWNAYRRAKKRAVEENRLIPRCMNTDAKNYYCNDMYGYWYVKKTVNGKTHSFKVANEKEAKALVGYLNEHGWSKKKAGEFREKYAK